MTTHSNSIAAFRITEASRHSLEAKILVLMADGAARTDRQITQELGLTETVRPRITAPAQADRLHEVGSKVCPTTGKTVRLTKRFL